MRSFIKSLQFLLFWSHCIISRSAIGADHQLCPKFRSYDGPYNKDYFTGSLDLSYWHPAMQTVLLQLRGEGFAVQADIDDVTRQEKLKFKLKIQCSPTDAETVHPFEFSTTSTKVFCNSPDRMAIEIEPQFSDWTSDTSYRLRLSLRPTINRVSFSRALWHYARIQLVVTGRHWTLESNGLFLRNWDPLFQLNSEKTHGRNYPLRFFTDEAINLMRNLSIETFRGFKVVQFLNQDVVQLLYKAPDLVRATIGIGAMLSINNVEYTCAGGLRATRNIAFMSKNFAELDSYKSMHILRLDQLTGKLTFSHLGLLALANSIAESSATPYICSRNSNSPSCTVARICAWLDFTPYGRFPTEYLRKELMIIAEWPDSSPYIGAVGSQVPWDDCHVAEYSSRVTIFARESVNTVHCPIICARPDQPYAFYKGSSLLLPISGPDFTDIGAVSVHKSGSVLQFSERVTNDDSGEYACTAGNKQADFLVEIVSLPLFRIYDTEHSGQLPSKQYVRSRSSYSLQCSVFYSGMMYAVTLTAEFYVVLDRRNFNWTKLTTSEFSKLMELYDASASVTVSRTNYGKKLTVSVSHVPPPTDTFDFSHRLVCNAEVSAEDMQRFGVTEYKIQSGCDVIALPDAIPMGQSQMGLLD